LIFHPIWGFATKLLGLLYVSFGHIEEMHQAVSIRSPVTVTV